MLRQYSNNHLAEVNCGFVFNNETTPWDSTLFGQFYEKIRKEGFNAKEERKGVQFTFNVNQLEKFPISSTQEIEDQVIFKNNEKGWAISMSKNKVSFHIIKNYTNWQDFLNNFIKPYFAYYKELGLGNGMRQCNMVYLNRFQKPLNEKLSDDFTLISPTEDEFGIEKITAINRIIENETNLLIAKFNSQVISNIRNINFECGAICKSVDCMNSKDWVDQADKTHAPVRNFFESIITEKLRAIL
jgi:uncharacterized protein (TIGR04255 family)